MSLLTLLLMLLVLSFLFGGWGVRRGWGYYGWGPMGLVILIVLVLLLTGGLRG